MEFAVRSGLAAICALRQSYLQMVVEVDICTFASKSVDENLPTWQAAVSGLRGRIDSPQNITSKVDSLSCIPTALHSRLATPSVHIAQQAVRATLGSPDMAPAQQCLWPTGWPCGTLARTEHRRPEARHRGQ